jgi:hypothetical protein
MISPSRCFFIAPALAFLAFVTTQPSHAQSTNRQIGTSFTVTAEPLVARPHEKPCVVQLFSGYTFATFAETDQSFPFAPPADCQGPWEKVVLELDFSENAGIQFDRTASLYLANTNLYFGTTPEPLQTATNTWHVERDVTDYSALFTGPQTGTMVLQNCTSTDCPTGYSYLNGVFTVNAELQFYPAPRHGFQPPAETPDAVLPLEQPNSSGGVSLPAILSTPTQQLTTTFTLPTNVERVYLDVISQNQSDDEQWYACFPNNLIAINDFFGCGNTDFRETEITIDGQNAGLAPASPWVFTGFLPDEWVPIPAAQTLEFVPYRVNLTPFAALLSDGKPHTVAMSVFNDDSYFSVTGSLLLFLDKGSKQITGELTKDTLTAPNPVVSENLQGTTTVTGTIGVTQDRDFTIAGYVNTSHGKVETSISGRQKFSSTIGVDFNTDTGDPLDQNTSVQNAVSTTTTVSSWAGALTTQENFSFPITVDVEYPITSSPYLITATTSQNYHTDKQVFLGPFPIYFNSVTNTVKATDISPAASSQSYTSFDSTGAFYNCQIASKENTLTSVSRGCNAPQF